MHAAQDYAELDPSCYRGDRKDSLSGEWVKYLLVCLFLFVFLRPLGVIVAVIWGVKLYKRSFRKELATRLREHWVDHELAQRRAAGESPRSMGCRRVGHKPRQAQHSGKPGRAEGLVRDLGEKPAPANLKLARHALAELDQVETESSAAKSDSDEALRPRPLCMANLVEDTAQALQGRARAAGVELRVETDSEGAMRGDPEKLRRALFYLLRDRLAAAEADESETPRVSVQMGENLAGTEVWVRLRDDRKRAAPYSPESHDGLRFIERLVRAHGGSIELKSGTQDGNEILLTFPKTLDQSGARS